MAASVAGRSTFLRAISRATARTPASSTPRGTAAASPRPPIRPHFGLPRTPISPPPPSFRSVGAAGAEFPPPRPQRRCFCSPRVEAPQRSQLFLRREVRELSESHLKLVPAQSIENGSRFVGAAG